MFLVGKGLLIKYLRNWWVRRGGGVIQNAYSCVQGEGCHASSVRTHLHYLFSYFCQDFCLIMSCFIYRYSTLSLFKKDLFVRNCNFSPTRSTSIVMK